MHPRDGQGTKGRNEKRRERRGPGPGLVAGIAAVVVIGVASKVFNRRSKSSNTKAATESLTNAIAGNGNSSSLSKDAVSAGENSHHPVTEIATVGSLPMTEAAINGEKSTSLQSPNEFIDNEDGSVDSNGVPSQSTDDVLCATVGDSSLLVTEVKIPSDKLVATDKDGFVPSQCKEIKPSSQSSESQLVNQAANDEAKSDAPCEKELLIHSKALHDGIAEVVSCAFENLGRGKLGEDLESMKLKVTWEDNSKLDGGPASDPRLSFAADIQVVSRSAATTPRDSVAELYTAEDSLRDIRDHSDRAVSEDKHLERAFDNAEAQTVHGRINSEPAECDEHSSDPLNSPLASSSCDSFDSNTMSPSGLASPTNELKDESTGAFLPSRESGKFFATPLADGDLPSMDRKEFMLEDSSNGHADKVPSDESEEEAKNVLRETLCSESAELLAERQLEGTDSELPHMSRTAIYANHDMDEVTRLEGDTPRVPPDIHENDANRDLASSNVQQEANTKNVVECFTAQDTSTTIRREEDDTSETRNVNAGQVMQTPAIAPENDDGTTGEVNLVKSSALPAAAACSFNYAGKDGELVDTRNPKTDIVTTMDFTPLSDGKREGLKQRPSGRDWFPAEVLRMAVLVAFIAAVVLMLRDSVKPFKEPW